MYQVRLENSHQAFRQRGTRDSRQRLIHQQDEDDWRYGGDRISVCKYCNHYHENNRRKCYIFCNYCHSLHFKKDLINGLCPNLQPFSKPLRDKKAFRCEECEGNGNFQELVETTLMETQEKYQQRIKNSGSQHLEVKPERKIFKKQHNIKTFACKTCQGTGKIYRTSFCCSGGCRICDYKGTIGNPLWQKLRLKGQKNDQIFPCRVCTKQVQISEIILKLRCGHAFHRHCIIKMAERNPVCFICGNTDQILVNFEKQSRNSPKKTISSLFQIGKQLTADIQRGQSTQPLDIRENPNLSFHVSDKSSDDSDSSPTSNHSLTERSPQSSIIESNHNYSFHSVHREQMIGPADLMQEGSEENDLNDKEMIELLIKQLNMKQQEKKEREQ